MAEDFKKRGFFCSKQSSAWLTALPGRRRQALFISFFSCLQSGVISYLLNSNQLLHYWHRWLLVNIFLSEQCKLKDIQKRSRKTLEKTLGARWDRELKHLPWICPPIYCKVYFKVSSLSGVMINGFEKAFFSAAPPNKGFRINSHHPTSSLMDF